MKKILFLLVVVIACTSCQKDYVCLCTHKPVNQDTILEHIKTTKLGSKGYKKTCTKYESRNPNLVDCRIR